MDKFFYLSTKIKIVSYFRVLPFLYKEISDQSVLKSTLVLTNLNDGIASGYNNP